MAIILAPMEGVVDPTLRDIYTEIGGYDLCVTEFIRVTSQIIPPKVFYRYSPELLNEGRTRSGVPVMVQLLGSDLRYMEENAQIALELGAPGVDLNFGCPAKTVNRHDGGSILLKSPKRVFDIVNSVARSGGLVTAKIRLGYEDKSLFLENAIACEEAGAKWLTVHARTKVEGYLPPAHWEFIQEISEKLSIPVIANGDIWSVEDVHKCLRVTGCKHVMLGRGAIARPDLGLQIKNANLALENLGFIDTSQTKNHQKYKWENISPLLLKMIDHPLSQNTKQKTLPRLKQWLRQLRRNYLEAETIFENVKLIREVDALLEGWQNPKGCTYLSRLHFQKAQETSLSFQAPPRHVDPPRV